MSRYHLAVVGALLCASACSIPNNEKARVVEVKRHLRTVAAAESTFFASHGHFPQVLDSLVSLPVPPYTEIAAHSTSDTTVTVIASDSRTSYVCWLLMTTKAGAAATQELVCTFRRVGTT